MFANFLSGPICCLELDMASEKIDVPHGVDSEPLLAHARLAVQLLPGGTQTLRRMAESCLRVLWRSHHSLQLLHSE